MTDRRAFLRALGAASGVAGLGSVATACTPDGPRDGRAQRPGRADAAALRPLTRPTLRTWAPDIVWVDVPEAELPVAYVSMERMQVFVDYDYRDRATWLLHAHISVSTALWRIPLPGDPPGEPIMPGDVRREFEELPMRAWDPSMRPSMDDIRIVRGRATERALDFSCIPLVGGGDGDPALSSGVEREAWLAGGPIPLTVSDGSGIESIREDFRILGTGSRWSERTCSSDVEAVQLVGWAQRD